MFLKKISEIFSTLAFRLTLWYTVIFILSSLGAFVAIYLTISTTLSNRIDNELVGEIEEFNSMWKAKGQDGVKDLMMAEVESDGFGETFFRIIDLKGNIIYSSNMSTFEGVGIGRNALKQLITGAGHVFETLDVSGRQFGVRIVYGTISADRILQCGVPLEDDALFLRALKQLFSQVMLAIVFVSAFIGWFMATSALSGVRNVTETAREISKGAFDQRVQFKSGGKEITELAVVFNTMLDHIHTLIKGMREMTDNIAHDLKTPITRIRGIAEMNLNIQKTENASQNYGADIIEECDYLVEMINTMLDISEAEAGAMHLKKESINISDIVQNAFDLFLPLAAEKRVKLLLEMPEGIFVQGDLHSLQRMIVNILENAIKYTPSDGIVSIAFDGSENDRFIISFTDTGMGISEQDMPHIFKRLYRCDTSRSQPGFGLGLSLARAIARAHGGDIDATSQPGNGSVFFISLPKGSLL